MDQKMIDTIAENALALYKSDALWHEHLQKQIAAKQCSEKHARELLTKRFREIVERVVMGAMLPIKRDRIELRNKILGMYPKMASGEMPWMTDEGPSETSEIAQ